MKKYLSVLALVFTACSVASCDKIPSFLPSTSSIDVSNNSSIISSDSNSDYSTTVPSISNSTINSSDTSSSSSVSTSSSSISSSSSSSTSSSSSSTSNSSSTSVEFPIPVEAGTYYNSINFQQTQASLKTSLAKLINPHTVVSYDGLKAAFQYTDTRPNGNIWDMYSNVNWSFGGKVCGNYGKEGDCYNREHSVPKSWFNEAKPAYSDLFHLYPTDGYVNGRRSNYAFGEVDSATYTSGNGSKLGKGISKYGYTGTVFEPIDEYKGDFARTYFYFVTCYETLSKSSGDGAVHFTSQNGYPGLTQYSINLFLTWATNDPISQKEIDRNNVIFTKYQKNRNPYIDFPNLANYMWGNLKTI